jgi:DNA polymerase-3 subunit delta
MDPRIRSLNQALAKGVAPIYLIDGEETLLVDEAAKLVEVAALGTGLRDFNLDKFQLGEAGADAILNALATLPMMADRRVVVVRCPKGLDDATLEALAGYAESPSPRATLVLAVTGKVNANLKLPRAVKKLGGLYRFEPLKPREVPAWIIDHTASIGFAIRPDAAAMLADCSGTDLLALSTQIDKLIAYTAGKRPIERGDVDAVVERTREEVVWDLTDAVGEGNLQKALATLDSLLEHAQSPIAVAALLTRHLRQLWTVKCAARKGMAPDQIAAEHKIHPFVAKKLLAQTHRFDDDTLKAHFDRLFRADRDLKSSKLDDSLIMERLVFELCSRGR